MRACSFDATAAESKPVPEHPIQKSMTYGLTTSIVRGRSQRLASSLDLGWKGVGIEHHIVGPGHKPETPTDLHVISIAAGDAPSHGQRRNARGRIEPYTKEPGTFSIFPAGALPTLYPATETQLIVCALERGFVESVAAESGVWHVPQATVEEGLRDADIVLLGRLLLSEAATRGQSGHLYVDHLAHALAHRLLHRWRLLHSSAEKRDCLLPPRSIRRVLERMHADLSADLSLKELAAESGFSRNHFIRSFQKVTGETPHRYLLRLRVERARTLIREKKMRLIDVAVSCGFANDAQLSRAFRSRLGISPSEYRRNIS